MCLPAFRRQGPLRSGLARPVGGPLQRHGARRRRRARGRDRAPAPRRTAGTRRWRAALALLRGSRSGPGGCGAPWHFDTESATRALTEQFRTRDLAGFGCADKPLAIAAAGALLAYVRETQKSALPHLSSITTEERDDAAHHGPRHPPQSGARRESRGPAGTDSGRRVRSHGHRHGRAHAAPLAAPAAARPRHSARPLPRRRGLAGNRAAHGRRHAAQGHRRLERIVARIALRSARPRDLTQLRAALAALPELQRILGATPSPLLQELITELHRNNDSHRDDHALLGQGPGRVAAALPARRRRHRRGLRRRARRAAPARQQHRAIPARSRTARTRAQRPVQPEIGLQSRAGIFHRSEPQPGRQGSARVSAPPDGEIRRALHHPGTQSPSRTRCWVRAIARWPARRLCTKRCSTT